MTNYDLAINGLTLFGTYILSPAFILWMIVIFFFSGNRKH